MENNTRFRVFISYRGNTDGMKFSDRLFTYLTEESAFSVERYGNIYFSPKVRRFGNFKKDIPHIMKDVEYFVLPLTEGFFKDFVDDRGDIRSKSSITYRELAEAFKKKNANDDSIHFVCIRFPGYTDNPTLLKRIFGKNADYILCTKPIEYSSDKEKEIELLREIGDSLVQSNWELQNDGASSILCRQKPNIFLSDRHHTDDKTLYPFYQKLYDVKHMTFLNYASTTFVTGVDIADIYKESDDLKRFFWEKLACGDISADMILTDPHSYAAQDAADYKMFPQNPNRDVPSNRIIIHNLNALFKFKRKHPKAKLKIHLTQIALPYGIMMTEHRNPQNNHMKVDLYAALPPDDLYRPSFYMLRNDEKTTESYGFFLQNIDKIKSMSYDFSDGHPDFSWLRNKKIIHRGVLNKELMPHTRGAFEACIDAHSPMEVDLLRLQDGTIILGRRDQVLCTSTAPDFPSKLLEFNNFDLMKYNRIVPRESNILRLREFCELVGDRIPVLFEIKTDGIDFKSESIKAYVERIVNLLRHNFRRCAVESKESGIPARYVQKFAIHSANPDVIKHVKEYDCMIPCGMISTDFSKVDNVDEGFIECHRTASFMQSAHPDFLSYDVRYLDNGIASKVCRDWKIPLFVWTIEEPHAQKKQEKAEALEFCESIIIEGAPSYLP